MKRDVLNVLIRKSKVIQIEGDEFPFSHNLNQAEEIGKPRARHAGNIDQDYYDMTKRGLAP